MENKNKQKKERMQKFKVYHINEIEYFRKDN